MLALSYHLLWSLAAKKRKNTDENEMMPITILGTKYYLLLLVFYYNIMALRNF